MSLHNDYNESVTALLDIWLYILYVDMHSKKQRYVFTIVWRTKIESWPKGEERLKIWGSAEGFASQGALTLVDVRSFEWKYTLGKLSIQASSHCGVTCIYRCLYLSFCEVNPTFAKCDNITKTLDATLWTKRFASTAWSDLRFGIWLLWYIELLNCCTEWAFIWNFFPYSQIRLAALHMIQRGKSCVYDTNRFFPLLLHKFLYLSRQNVCYVSNICYISILGIPTMTSMSPICNVST